MRIESTVCVVRNDTATFQLVDALALRLRWASRRPRIPLIAPVVIGAVIAGCLPLRRNAGR
jgi:hypothetical protein